MAPALCGHRGFGECPQWGVVWGDLMVRQWDTAFSRAPHGCAITQVACLKHFNFMSSCILVPLERQERGYDLPGCLGRRVMVPRPQEPALPPTPEGGGTDVPLVPFTFSSFRVPGLPGPPRCHLGDVGDSF